MKAIKSLIIVCALLCLPISASANRHKSDDIKASELISSLEKASFTISANIYFGEEDEEKIPITGDFYLLNHSVVSILKKADFNPVDENDLPLSKDSAYLEAVANTFAEPGDENDLLASLIREIVQKEQVTVIKTNRYGTGASGTIKAGYYFLFAAEKVENEIFVWNLPVYLSGKTNEIEIDQYNIASSSLTD